MLSLVVGLDVARPSTGDYENVDLFRPLQLGGHGWGVVGRPDPSRDTRAVPKARRSRPVSRCAAVPDPPLLRAADSHSEVTRSGRGSDAFQCPAWLSNGLNAPPKHFRAKWSAVHPNFGRVSNTTRQQANQVSIRVVFDRRRHACAAETPYC